MAALKHLFRRKSIFEHSKRCLTSSSINHSPEEIKIDWKNKKDTRAYVFKTLTQMHMDLSMNGIIRAVTADQRKKFIDSEKHIPERHRILGNELAPAHFVVARGGRVKFVGHDKWVQPDKAGQYYLPNKKVDDMFLEAVDVSRTSISPYGLENFVNMSSLRYFNCSNCTHVDDWFLGKLGRFEKTLEFLDISGCTQITHRGISSLHHLRKLEGLRVSNLENVEHIEYIVTLLEEYIPGLLVFGLPNETFAGNPTIEAVEDYMNGGNVDNLLHSSNLSDNGPSANSKLADNSAVPHLTKSNTNLKLTDSETSDSREHKSDNNVDLNDISVEEDQKSGDHLQDWK